METVEETLTMRNLLLFVSVNNSYKNWYNYVKYLMKNLSFKNDIIPIICWTLKHIFFSSN